jgi:hypothetical protein
MTLAYSLSLERTPVPPEIARNPKNFTLTRLESVKPVGFAAHLISVIPSEKRTLIA